MLKVLLIGDSIRMSYEASVKAILGERANVLGAPENCRFSAYTLFMLATWGLDNDAAYISDDKVHLSPAGVELCAERVSAAILG
jgi:lysophospholipase L1-like esterase